MTQATEHRTVTADKARAEYVAACCEVVELEAVIGFLDDRIADSLNVAQCATFSDRVEVRYVGDRFWSLLNMRTIAVRRLQDVLAGRGYAFNVWQSAKDAAAAADPVRVDANVSTLTDMHTSDLT